MKLSRETLESAFDLGVSVGQIIHVQGCLINSEELSDGVREFIIELPYLAKTLADGWPSIHKDIRLNEDEDEDEDEDNEDEDEDNEDFIVCDRADRMLRVCPVEFIVEMRTTDLKCIKADPSMSEGCGSWGSSGWFTHWHAVDSVNDAVLQAIERAKEMKAESWHRAVKEGRVYKPTTES